MDTDIAWMDDLGWSHSYLRPDGKVGHDAFAVIRETIHEMDKVAIGRVVLTNREHIIALEPMDKGLVGTLLRYPYEVRREQEYFDEIQDVKVTKDMLDLARHIVNQKAGTFDPGKFEDHYESALVDLVNQKRAGKTMRSQIQFPEPIATVVITDQLAYRQAAAPDFLCEKLAIQDLAEVMSDHPDGSVSSSSAWKPARHTRQASAPSSPKPANSAGTRSPASSRLRRRHHAAQFQSLRRVPRLAEPILMERPERAYDWIRDAGITVPKVLLVPLRLKGAEAMGTLWLVAPEAGHFNKEPVRFRSELAAFAGMALRMIQTEQRLSLAMQQQTLMREMGHRIKNLFSVADSMVRMAPASFNTEIAHLRSVRIAGRLSFVISIEIVLSGRIRHAPPSFPAVSTGQGFKIARACLFHLFRPPVQKLSG